MINFPRTMNHALGEVKSFAMALAIVWVGLYIDLQTHGMLLKNCIILHFLLVPHLAYHHLHEVKHLQAMDTHVEQQDCQSSTRLNETPYASLLLFVLLIL